MRFDDETRLKIARELTVSYEELPEDDQNVWLGEVDKISALIPEPSVKTISDDAIRLEVAKELCNQERALGSRAFDEHTAYSKKLWLGRAGKVLALIPDAQAKDELIEELEEQVGGLASHLAEVENKWGQAYNDAENLRGANEEFEKALSRKDERIKAMHQTKAWSEVVILRGRIEELEEKLKKAEDALSQQHETISSLSKCSECPERREGTRLRHRIAGFDEDLIVMIKARDVAVDEANRLRRRTQEFSAERERTQYDHNADLIETGERFERMERRLSLLEEIEG